MNIPKHRLELPPEADHLHAKPPRKPSKRRIRKQGGQEGHKRQLRELVPIEQCEAVIPCVPGRDRVPAPPRPLRLLRYHDVSRATMRRAPRAMWSAIGSLHWAAHGALPPKQAKRASSFLSDLLNIPCSPAWTVKIQNLDSDALSEPYCQLQSELAKQSQLYVDESPTTQQQGEGMAVGSCCSDVRRLRNLC